MRLFVIDRETPANLLNKFLLQLRLILSDLEYEYPFFTKWLEKVFNEMVSSNKRKIIVCSGENLFDIWGLSIIKNSDEEKKICTLRVIPNYQRRGIGTILLQKSIEMLGDSKPLLTVSERYIDVFKPFLRKNGFILKNKVKSLYQKGSFEYFFNHSYVSKVVLLPIKPKYVNEIILGNKKVEFRKQIFSESVQRVYVYSSYPVKRIVGYFDVTDIAKDTPSNLWAKYHNVGCIKEKDYITYFENKKYGYGIEINKMMVFTHPLDVLDFDREFKAPQSYCYLNNVRFLKWLTGCNIKGYTK